MPHRRNRRGIFLVFSFWYPAQLLIAAGGGVEDLRGNPLDRLPAAVKGVENSENNGVTQAHPGSERKQDHGKHCKRHHKG